MKKIYVGLSLILILLLLTGCTQNSKDYKNALSLMETGAYQEAITILKELDDYKESKNKLQECLYLLADDYRAAKQYREAKQVLDELLIIANEEWKVKGQESIEQTLFEWKYSELVVSVNEKDFKADFGLEEHATAGPYEFITSDLMEEWIASRFYGKWYTQDNTVVCIDKFEIDNQNYRVKYACTANILRENVDAVSVILYDDSTEKNGSLHISKASFSISDTETVEYSLMFYEVDGNQRAYFNITLDEMEELTQKQQAYFAELAARRPNYADQTIVDNTFNMFMDKRKSLAYDIRETLYMTGNVQASDVTYDYTTKTYICTLNIEFIENPLDIWGYTHEYYFVEATFKDTGSNLIMTSFDCY